MPQALFLACHFLWLVSMHAQAAAISDLKSSDMIPKMEVSLAPPVQPLPQISAEIGNLDKSRETFESANMDKILHAYNIEVDEAKIQIGDKIGRVMSIFNDPTLFKASRSAKTVSFLARDESAVAPTEKFTVKVNVLPASPPDPLTSSKIDSIERERYGHEKSMFQRTIVEMKSLTEFFLKELEAAIQEEVSSLMGRRSVFAARKQEISTLAEAHQVAFTETDNEKFLRAPGGLPKQANVQVVASDIPYPTVSSMVQDMEIRRDISENLAKAKIQQLKLNLLKAENQIAADALKHAIERILVQHDPLNIATKI